MNEPITSNNGSLPVYFRALEAEYTRGHRTVRVDRCQYEGEGPFWEVWERVEENGQITEICYTEDGNEFYRLPDEDDVWNLVDIILMDDLVYSVTEYHVDLIANSVEAKLLESCGLKVTDPKLYREAITKQIVLMVDDLMERVPKLIAECKNMAFDDDLSKCTENAT